MPTPVQVAVDMVNHPPHYNSHPSGVQAIEIGRHLSADWFNAFKYIFRCDHKNGREDVDKARWYAEDAVQHNMPVRAPSWSKTENTKLVKVINAEPDLQKRQFYWAILEQRPQNALAHIKGMLA
jgi:hypothetical protein